MVRIAPFRGIFYNQKNIKDLAQSHRAALRRDFQRRARKTLQEIAPTTLSGST